MSTHNPPPPSSRSPEEPALALCHSCHRPVSLSGMPLCAACMLGAAGAGPRYPSQSRLASPAGALLSSWLAGHTAHLAPGTAVGTYVVESCLGEGGFAEVYSGRAMAGGPTIAIKLLKPGMDSRELSARFRAEQRLLGHLSHPGIVRVIDSGQTEEKRSFFVMEQVDGLPITEYCEAERLTLRQRIELFVQVCDAIHHAHQKGVLHRDLKPSNILVAERGSTPPEPKVIDFGIAKVLDDDGSTGNTLVTRLGQVMGTPAYMAPEQAAGGDDADIRSDLYSLGAVLWEMLTGHPPYTTAELQKLPPGAWAGFLREHEPGAPSTHVDPVLAMPVTARELRGDLDHIVLKAMAREPERRYASVEALATDLRQWLTGGIVSARPPSVIYQLERLVRRHKMAAAVMLATLVAIITASVLGFFMAVQARNAERVTAGERDKAVRAEESAHAARERAEREGYQASVQLARLQLASGEPYLAAERLRATNPRLRGWEWGYLLSATPQAEAVMESALPGAMILAATPDGHFAAVAAGKMVHVLDLQTRAILTRLAQPEPVSALALSDDGSTLAALTYPQDDTLGTVRVSRLDGSHAWTAPVETGGDLAWEPAAAGSALLVIGGNGRDPVTGRLTRFECDTGRLLTSRTIRRYKVAGRGITVDPRGGFAAVRRSYAEFEVVRLPSLEAVNAADGDMNQFIQEIVFDPKGDRLLFTWGHTVSACPGITGPAEIIGGLVPGPDDPPGLASGTIRHFALLPDGRWLAAGDKTERIENGLLQPCPTMKEIASTALTDGRRAALLAGGRVEIRSAMLSTPTQDLPSVSPPPTPEARRLAFAPDSSLAVFQSWERKFVGFLDPAHPDAAHMHEVPARKELEWTLLPAFHPDGSVFFAGRESIEAARFDGQTVSTVPLPIPVSAWSSASTADGRQVAFGTPQGVMVLDWASKRVAREWPIAGAPFHVFAATDGPTFFALGADSRLHRLGSNPLSTLVGDGVRHSKPPVADFCSARGLLAIAEPGGCAILAFGPAGAPALLGHLHTEGRVTALAFDPAAHRLAVATEARTLTVWDWEAALPLLELPVHHACASIAWSPDGRWLGHTDFEPSVVLRKAGE